MTKNIMMQKGALQLLLESYLTALFDHNIASLTLDLALGFKQFRCTECPQQHTRAVKTKKYTFLGKF